VGLAEVDGYEVQRKVNQYLEEVEFEFARREATHVVQ
jgi:hypothetical protein